MFKRDELVREYARAAQWLPLIQAAVGSRFPVSLLLAIGSRETNLNSVYQFRSGDNGHGYSMWQIDIRSFPDFVNSGDWKDVGKAVNKAVEVLSGKLAEVKKLGPSLGESDALQIAVAAYNCGSRRAYSSFVARKSPDYPTTGHDYSSDVLARKAVFDELIGSTPAPAQDPDPDTPAPAPLVERLAANEDLRSSAKDAGKSALTRLIARGGAALGALGSALDAWHLGAWVIVIVLLIAAGLIIYLERDRLKVVAGHLFS